MIGQAMFVISYNMKSIQQYQSIILRRDINLIIRKELQGTIIEILDSETFEAELVKEDGANYEFEGGLYFYH